MHRQKTRVSRKEYQLIYDTLGGWKMILYFNQFKRIKDDYSAVIVYYIALEIKLYLYHWLASIIQDYVLDIGLLIAYFYTVY